MLFLVRGQCVRNVSPPPHRHRVDKSVCGTCYRTQWLSPPGVPRDTVLERGVIQGSYPFILSLPLPPSHPHTSPSHRQISTWHVSQNTVAESSRCSYRYTFLESCYTGQLSLPFLLPLPLPPSLLPLPPHTEWADQYVTRVTEYSGWVLTVFL